MTNPKFKVVVQRPEGTKSLFGSNTYEMERDALDPIGAEIIEIDAATEEEFVDAARDADAVIGHNRRISENIIAHLERCRVIGLGSVGADTVDVDAATTHGIVVTNVPDIFIEEVADHTMAMFLAAFRRLPEMHKMTIDGRWSDGRPLLSEFPRLWGQTIGLISFGNVAKAVARRCHAFGLRVVAYDPYLSELEMSSVDVEPESSLLPLLRRSDFVSMHAPLNSETRHMLT
ncbi:MAG TPA: C-terminal binding protein, partial [Alphaproteobacteria bacterium]|nr:C-terminal binding protein [Alphaproteobacteria bacterium]